MPFTDRQSQLKSANQSQSLFPDFHIVIELAVFNCVFFFPRLLLRKRNSFSISMSSSGLVYLLNRSSDRTEV